MDFLAGIGLVFCGGDLRGGCTVWWFPFFSMNRRKFDLVLKTNKCLLALLMVGVFVVVLFCFKCFCFLVVVFVEVSNRNSAKNLWKNSAMKSLDIQLVN